MTRRGFSVVELLFALLITTVLILAVGSFYVQTVRAWWQGQTQADLRRLAGLVHQEMARIIKPAVGLPPGSCGAPGATASLPVHLPAGALPDPQLAQGAIVCFYRDPGNDQLVRCQIVSLANTVCAPGTEANLLSSLPISDPVRLTDLPGEPGTGLMFARGHGGGTWVEVSLNLAVVDARGATQAGPVSFSTRFAVEN